MSIKRILKEQQEQRQRFICYGDYDISNTNIKSLSFCPDAVKGSFAFESNNLRSLKGVPEIVEGSFFGSGNDLKRLDYMPKVIGGNNISFRHTFLETLKGFENTKIKDGATINLFNSSLKDIEGIPSNFKGLLNLNYNPEINSLYGCPEELEALSIEYCYIESFEHLPKVINGDLYCEGNYFSEEELRYYKHSGAVKGKIYSDHGIIY